MVLFVATLLLTFLILVFSEVTPKVIGASFPERVAYPATLLLTPLLTLAYPVVWFVNLFVQGILKLLHSSNPTGAGQQPGAAGTAAPSCWSRPAGCRANTTGS